jgi:hypothetical protein
MITNTKALELLKIIDQYKDDSIKYHLYTQLQRWVEKNVSNKIQAEVLAKKIGLKKSLEIIYNLEFTGFIQLERIWWWRNYIEYTKYQEIIYPKHGFISVVRLNQTHKHPNTIRVMTKQSNSGKRELVVLRKLFGKEEENYERKRNLKEDWKSTINQKI